MGENGQWGPQDMGYEQGFNVETTSRCFDLCSASGRDGLRQTEGTVHCWFMFV